MDKDNKNLNNNLATGQNAQFAPPPRPSLPQKSVAEEKQALKTQPGPSKAKPTKSAKQKVQKPKKQKTSKKTKKLGKIAAITGAFVGLAAAVVVGIIVLLGSIKANAQLVISPDNAVVSLKKAGEQYYLVAQQIDGADIYFFEIKNKDNDITVIEANKNVVEATGAFESFNQYEIRFYIQKQARPKTKSKPTDWQQVAVYGKISTPNLSYDDKQKQLVWSQVANASTYTLHYSGKQGITTIEANPVFNQGKAHLSLDDLGLPLGYYQFSVVANPSQQQFYLPSEASEKVFVAFTQTMPEIKQASYNFLTKILTVTLHAPVSEAKVKIVFENASITTALPNNLLVYDINLQDFTGIDLESGKEIYVCLSSSKDFVLDGEKTQVVFEN